MKAEEKHFSVISYYANDRIKKQLRGPEGRAILPFHCYDNKQNYYNHAHETVTILYHDQQPDEAFPQRRT